MNNGNYLQHYFVIIIPLLLRIPSRVVWKAFLNNYLELRAFYYQTLIFLELFSIKMNQYISLYNHNVQYFIIFLNIYKKNKKKS